MPAKWLLLYRLSIVKFFQLPKLKLEAIKPIFLNRVKSPSSKITDIPTHK